MLETVGRKTLAVDIEGDGEPVVFLHGLGSTSSVWEPQVMAFRDRFKIVRYDLEGAGRSPLSEAPSIASWVSDLAALLDKHAIATARFVGHSLGTLILQHFAVLHPQRVTKLVFIGVNRAPPEARRAAVRERVAKVRAEGIPSIAAGIVKGGLSPHTFSSKPEVVGFVRELLLRQSTEGYAACCEAMASSNAAEISKIDCPVMVIAGDDDAISPPANGSGFAGELAHGTFRSIEKCGHWHPIEQPAALNKILGEFL
jgi:pimeloyl-ACP methyl ester carboxylesterase